LDLELSEDQELFQETTRSFLETEMPLSAVRRLADEPAGFAREWWRQGAALGWTSAFIPEDLGGGSVSEQPLSDLVIVAEEMGRRVSPGPLLPANVVAAAVAEKGTTSQRQEILPDIASGDSIASWAFAEPGGKWDPASIGLLAQPRSEGFVLDGEKAYVEAAMESNLFLVTARCPEGLVQLLLRRDTPGLELKSVESLDLVRRFGHLRFDSVEVEHSAVLGEPGAASDDVERQLQIALVLQCAEMVGAIDRVFEFTLEWAFDRYSFGRPLASYQALKHRFADMKMWLEACHATATAAAQAVHARAADGAELASVAKAYVGERAPEIIQDCVQMHGGIGVTWEHDLHLYLRRVTLDRALYGTPNEHLERVASALEL